MLAGTGLHATKIGRLVTEQQVEQHRSNRNKMDQISMESSGCAKHVCLLYLEMKNGWGRLHIKQFCFAFVSSDLY